MMAAGIVSSDDWAGVVTHPWRNVTCGDDGRRSPSKNLKSDASLPGASGSLTAEWERKQSAKAAGSKKA